MGKYGIRPAAIEARKRAFAGARLMIANPNINQTDAAKQSGTTRTSISSAMVIIQHGTKEEIAGVEGGLLALDPTADKIRARVPKTERKANQRAPARTPAMVEAIQLDAEVWGKLRTGLDAILSLPSPADTAAIVRKNNRRIEHVNNTLLTVAEWITEFADAITK